MYYEFSPLGRKFAVISKEYMNIALEIFPATTKKKKLSIWLFRLLALFKIPSPWLSVKNNVELFGAFDSNALNEVIYAELGRKLDVILVIWNREYSRQRVYVWLIDPLTMQRYFIKVAAGIDNLYKLKNESSILSYLENQNLLFCVPQKLFFIVEGDISILATEAIPNLKLTHEIVDWEKIGKTFLGLQKDLSLEMKLSDIIEKRWFKKIIEQEDEELVEELLGKLKLQESYAVGFAHGDLGSENSFMFKQNLWLIDWENAGFDVPILTDLVAHSISASKDFLGNAKASAKIEGSGCGDVLLALAFLISNGFELARPFFYKAIRNI